MKNGLDVFDFNDEDELSEIASRKYLDKFKNPNLNNPAMLKYEFLQFAAHGASVPQKEAKDIPCVDIEVNDPDRNCDDVVQSQPVRTSNSDSKQKGGDSVLDDCHHVEPNSCELQVDKKLGNSEPRTSPLELKLRDSGAEPASPRSQSVCLPSHSESSGESVDVFSCANRSLSECSSSTPTSDIAEDNGSAVDHCSGDMILDDAHQTIAISPDYILYQKHFWTGLVIFSGDGIKIKGSTSHGNLGIFNLEREIDDIIDIKCEWVRKTGYVMVQVDVLSTDIKEADDASSASGIEELKLMVFEPNWSEKQEAITSLNVKYLAIWEFKYEHLTEVDEGALPVQKSYFPIFDEQFEEVVYPKGDADAVSISKRDVDLLQPDTFVNDTIIDFYIKYLKNQIPVKERQRFHFFNSFFFRKLADLDKDPSSISDGRAAFLRVHKWTRKVDMFVKDYIFIPVNFNLHWSLIVVCHPGEVAAFKDEELDTLSRIPCILHMDSLRGSHDGLKNLVQGYLWEEWKGRHKESSEDLSSKFMNLRFISLELPQQENFYDCGLFLLHYLELFLTEAPDSFNPFKITKFSNFLNANWFLPTEASLKRTLIQKLIFELLEIRSREITLADCVDKHQSAEIPETDEMGVELITEECRPEVACLGDSLNQRRPQGIGISSLASSSVRNMQDVDSGLGLREELFEPGVTAGSLLGHFNSFVEPSCYNQNNSVSPRETEEADTGVQNAFLASGAYQVLTGMTSQACAVPFSSSRGLMLDDGSWNPGILTREHEIHTSPETSSGSDDDADVGIVESYGIGEKRVIGGNERNEAEVNPMEDDELEMKDVALPSSEVFEGIADAVSEKPDKLHVGNQDDSLLPTKERRRDDTQMSMDDPLTEPIEPVAKRIRFTLGHPGEEALEVLTHKFEMVRDNTVKCDDTEMHD